MKRSSDNDVISFGLVHGVEESASRGVEIGVETSGGEFGYCSNRQVGEEGGNGIGVTESRGRLIIADPVGRSSGGKIFEEDGLGEGIEKEADEVERMLWRRRNIKWTQRRCSQHE